MSEDKRSAKVTIYLRGKSRGHEDGDRRQVDAETAEDLVENSLARYPESKA